MKILTILTLVMGGFFTTQLYTSIKSEKRTVTQIKKEPTFKDFIKGFKSRKTPYKVTAEDLSKYKYTKQNLTRNKNKAIDSKYGVVFEDLNSSKFSRMPMESEAYYFAKLKETSKYTAVLYLNATSRGSSSNSVSCNLVIFSKEGEIIDREYSLAQIGYRGGHNSFSIDKNLQITKKTYEYSYKKNPKEIGYKKAEIIGNKLVKVDKFYISNTGKIEEMQQPAKASSAKG